MKKLLILLLTACSLFGQFKFQRSLPDRYTVFQLDRASVGSTVFKDASQYNNTITTYGNTVQSATQKKFGDGSVYFDGTGDYLRVAQSSIFNFGTNDLTVDFWCYINSLSAVNMLCSISETAGVGGVVVYTTTGGVLTLYSSSTGSSWDIVSGGSGGTLNTGQWYHIAVIRQTGYFKIYVNGSLAYTSSYSSSSIYYSSAVYTDIGGRGSQGNSSNCYIQEFRVTKGKALWTSNFTPPNKPY